MVNGEESRLVLALVSAGSEVVQTNRDETKAEAYKGWHMMSIRAKNVSNMERNVPSVGIDMLVGICLFWLFMNCRMIVMMRTTEYIIVLSRMTIPTV